MVFPEIGIIGASGTIAVFHPVHRLLRSAAAHVHPDYRFCTHFAAQLDKFRGTMCIIFNSAPGKIDFCGTQQFVPHCVHPMIMGTEITSPSNLCNSCFFHLFNNISPHPVRIGQGIFRHIYAAGYIPAKLFCEMTEQKRTYSVFYMLRINCNTIHYVAPLVIDSHRFEGGINFRFHIV